MFRDSVALSENTQRTLADVERSIEQLPEIEERAKEHRRAFEERTKEQLRKFEERAKQPRKQTLAAGAVVWVLLFPIWLGCWFVAAAFTNSYGTSITWTEIVKSLVPFALAWLALGWVTVGWWHEGRNLLWRPPLMWLLLIGIPLSWPALLSKDARAWLSPPTPPKRPPT